jgi:hypothetical protein
MDLRAYDLVKAGFRKVTRSTIDNKNPLDTCNVMETSDGDAINQTGETLPDGSKAGHVVDVGKGDSEIVTPTITVATSAYEANDCVGGLITLTDAMRTEGGKGVLSSVYISTGAIAPQLNVIIFDSEPEDTNPTDGTALVVHANDKLKKVTSFTVYASDFIKKGDDYDVDLKLMTQVEAITGEKDLYATVQAVATPDFVAATDLIMKFKFLRD